MIKRRHILLTVLSCGLMFLLSGCQMVVLNPKGVIGVDEKHLLITAVLLMLIVVLPVLVLTVFLAIKYRASNKKAKYTPNWAHSVTLEIIWWGVPLILIIILAFITWVSTHKLNPYTPINTKALGIKSKSITIQAVALRWKWLFIYPEQGIATINYVQFPVHRQIRFIITSDAPMNSFQIPQLGGQIYAMNGMQTKLHLIANIDGSYAGRSVNFSGTGFAGMKFTAKVTPEKDFDRWVETVKRSSHNKLTMKVYDQLVTPSKNNAVEYFSPVTNNLYHKIIMKFMSPHRFHNNFVIQVICITKLL